MSKPIDPAFKKFLARENYERFQRGEEFDDNEAAAEPECSNPKGHWWKPTVPPIRWAVPGVKPRPSAVVFMCEHCGSVRQ